MPTLDLVNQENKKVGTINLSETVFGAEVNIPLVHQVIKAQRAGFRQGTAKTKTKAEVRGGGRKPFKQKGTGNARQGSIRSPLQPGGGQSFGPQPRDYAQSTPKKMMRGALVSALSDRVKSERVLVVDQFKLDAVKTKTLAGWLSKGFRVSKALIVDEKNQTLELSGRNIKDIKILRSEGLNVYDIVKHEWLILTKNAVAAIEKRLA